MRGLMTPDNGVIFVAAFFILDIAAVVALATPAAFSLISIT